MQFHFQFNSDSAKKVWMSKEKQNMMGSFSQKQLKREKRKSFYLKIGQEKNKKIYFSK